MSLSRRIESTCHVAKKKKNNNNDPMEQNEKKGGRTVTRVLLLQNDKDCSRARGTVTPASGQWNGTISKAWTSLNQGVELPPPNPEKKETPTHIRAERTAVK